MQIFKKKSTILIVDDSTANIRILSEILGKEYQIIFATTGVDALESAVTGTPDLILLDIMMPEMDGYEICSRLKSDSRTSDIPVIFITSLDKEQHETVGLELGGIDYITKPINPNLVRLRIRNHMELKILQDHYKNLSSKDGLTGLANRRHFDEFLDREWRRSLRSRSILSLILMDIDCFKPYNDHYGHTAGDDCLKRIASIMFGTMERSTDLIARYGGEEFVCVLPGTDTEGAKVLAEKLRKRVASLEIPHAYSQTGKGYVTISLGIASMTPSKEGRWSALIESADKKLYQAKKLGRDCVVG
ncbi:MAG: diguanylate cyclase [Magnetococcales bacterium]|nr:diguanylate cyclase [Magnetococcales bacterium]